MRLTPIECRDGIFFKREDKFEFIGLHGAKVRSAYCLIQKAMAQGYTKVTTVGHRKSPQIQIVGELCKHFHLEFIGHTPQGELPEAFSKYNIIQHRAGYNNVIASRCHNYAIENDCFEVPFGMISRDSMMQTAEQVRRFPPGIKRIVVPVGSGVNLCGILLGFRQYDIHIPILGIQVGMSPLKLLKDYAPFGWQKDVTLIESPIPYAKQINDCVFHGIPLDPVYEAKCINYVEEGDLFWIIGIRNFKI